MDTGPTLLAAFQTREAVFMNLRYVQEPGDSFHDFANAFVAFLVLRSHLPVLECQHFHALRQGFVAFLQTFQAFFEGHI